MWLSKHSELFHRRKMLQAPTTAVGLGGCTSQGKRRSLQPQSVLWRGFDELRSMPSVGLMHPEPTNRQGHFAENSENLVQFNRFRKYPLFVEQYCFCHVRKLSDEDDVPAICTAVALKLLESIRHRRRCGSKSSRPVSSRPISSRLGRSPGKRDRRGGRIVLDATLSITSSPLPQSYPSRRHESALQKNL